jgi:hypothetical protein
MDRWLELSKRDEAEYEKQIALLKEKNECGFSICQDVCSAHALKSVRLSF